MLKKSLEVLEVIKVKKKNYEIAIKNTKKVFKNIETKYSKVMETICQNAEKIFEKNAQENVEKMFLKVLKKVLKKSVKMLNNI